jgi:hypothetical protein
MNSLKLKLDKDTYQYLKIKFNGDMNAMEDFAKKTLANEIEKEPSSSKQGKKKKY